MLYVNVSDMGIVYSNILYEKFQVSYMKKMWTTSI